MSGPGPPCVHVRMYNVGFGDAFLVVIPGPDGPKKVLFDCGSHSAGPGPRKIEQVVQQIIEDVTEDGVARIDVLVATHRHRDHVSGFARPEWNEVEVGEVWMPWTEDPADPAAREIREHQSSTAQRLQLALKADGAGSDSLALKLALNNLTNARAMETLHFGFAGSARRRFLPERDDQRTLVTDALPGIGIHVFGPPRDPETIRDMTPPTGESYLRAAQAAAAKDDEADAPPFPARWRIRPADYSMWGLGLEKRDQDRLKQFTTANPLGIAVALEKAVNGTSLVLVLQVGKASLLFPADAQWGTWKRLLEDPMAMEVLKRTTFIKVGHHGSHNATPRDFVERLQAAREHDEDTRELWAMVSTASVPIWKEIPRGDLLDALRGVTPNVARSDHGGSGERIEGFAAWSDDVIEAAVPIA